MNRLRALPDFLILGVQRGGTTSLYNYLCQHPWVAAASGKELHFFDNQYEPTLASYRAHFPLKYRLVLHRRRKRGFSRQRALTGEASPYYLYHPLVPQRVAAHLPQARLIALLRNPAERAVSHYWHEHRKGREPLEMLAAFEAEAERIAPEWQAVASGQVPHSPILQRHSYLSRGHYAEQLERWWAHFPRPQLLVLRSEDLFEKPQTVFEQVEAFLGLPHYTGMHFRPLNAGQYVEPPPAVSRFLRDYYAPHNARLQALLGEGFGWDDFPTV